MRQNAANRIMSLSFERKPDEHAEVMLQAGRRFMVQPGPRYSWPMLIGAVGFGASIGLLMEAYRSFLLVPVFGINDIAPLNVVVLQLLPFLVAIVGLLYLRARHIGKKRLKTLIDRIEPGQFIDTDIFTDGIRATTGTTAISLEWTGIRDISVRGSRVEFEAEAFVLYLPQRAFADRATFEAAVEKFRSLWLDALGRQKIVQESGTETGPAAVGPSPRLTELD